MGARAWLLCGCLWAAIVPVRALAQDLDDLDELADEDETGDEAADAAEEDDDGADGDDPSDDPRAGVEASEDAAGASDASDAQTDEDGRGLRVRFGGGLGAGSLAYERPRQLGTDKLDATPLFLAEAFVAMHLAPEQPLSLRFDLSYQTSLGLKLGFAPQFALPERIDARFQRVQLTAAPVFRLAGGPLSLSLPVGFALRTLTTQVHDYTVSGFVLSGATLGAELSVALAKQVTLGLQPVAQWLFILGSELPDDGVCCQGLGVGGRASIDVHLAGVFRASLAYDETHTFAPMGDYLFKSVVRMLTARLGGEL